MKPFSSRLTRLNEHVWVHQGPINVGIVTDGKAGLLIDFGTGDVMEALPSIGVARIDRVLFTHHHRDQACGAQLLPEEGLRIGVPRAEKALFDDVEAYWENPLHRWHLYDFHPHHLTLLEPLHVSETYEDGDIMRWGPAQISVVSTPGHTDGSVSYVLEVDGERIAFCGDAIYDNGRVWDVYSLQKGSSTSDYHGFMGAWEELVQSLQKLTALGPSKMVPSHGAIIEDPRSAVRLLEKRLRTCYRTYASTSSLRHYLPDLLSAYVEPSKALPIGPGKAVPPFLRHFGTTWLVISEDGAAFAMDCGSREVLGKLEEMEEDGTVRGVEGLWVTHYHDDHVDSVPEFRQRFGCPVIADEHVARILRNPRAWRLPCISPAVIPVDRVTSNGDSWRWHEFTFTAYHLPGQTLYGGGLLVDGHGMRLFFSGDSFTMAGIDDYCCGNRNFLGPGRGYELCLDLITKLKPDLIFNSHVDQAFTFDETKIEFLRENLKQRRREFGELIAWDDPNYGLDENWVRCFPYEQEMKPGEAAHVDLVVTNHSDAPRRAYSRLLLPREWGTLAQGSALVGPREEVSIRLDFAVPRLASPGRFVVAADLEYGDRFLPQIAEAILRVSASSPSGQER